MKTITLRGEDCQASLELALDKANNRATVLARSNDGQIQVPYLEINFQDMSVSILNSSDLGVTVDNVGLVTIHRAKIEGELIMQDPTTGNWWQFRPDSNGNLIGTPV